jgi:hypothetical protein
MPFWPLHPAMAQNQFRFGSSPQLQLVVIHRPVFDFGIVFCISYDENKPDNGMFAMGCLPHHLGHRADPAEFLVKTPSFSGFVFMD